MTTIKIRRGTSEQAATNNPVLEAGEPGYELDTWVFKIGDGVTPWSELQAIGDSEITPQEIGAAPLNHNHDGVYSPVAHNHNDTYAPLNHTHSGFAASSHNHDGAYLAKTADIQSIVKITQAAYDALTPKVATTLYVIVG